MIESVCFASPDPGPRLLVLGAVHGDEKCGTEACRRVIAELEQGGLALEKGSVTFVPVCNPRAYAQDVRFVERNLNRYLVPQTHPDCYEARIGNVLCPLLERCDVLLDIHSDHTPSKPFVFVANPGSPEHDYARCLGASAALTGWADAYAASGTARKAADAEESTGTTEYARRFGAIAATLECGRHKDPETRAVAYRAIRNALAFLGMTAGRAETAETPLIRVTRVIYRGQGGQLARNWVGLDPVGAGTVLARDDAGAEIVAPRDGFIIIPNPQAPAGSEWFYWGERADGV